jgi:hypothetical protein
MNFSSIRNLYGLPNSVCPNIEKAINDKLLLEQKAINDKLLLEQNLDKVHWKPDAIHLLEQNLDKVDWNALSWKPDAIHKTIKRE